MRPDLHRGLMDLTGSSPARRVVLCGALTRRDTVPVSSGLGELCGTPSVACRAWWMSMGRM
jgi:hypothetical protein